MLSHNFGHYDSRWRCLEPDLDLTMPATLKTLHVKEIYRQTSLRSLPHAPTFGRGEHRPGSLFVGLVAPCIPNIH